ncbi:uncharacterized protein CDAR_179771 [Caerostris darwini]|uniref:Uncharacterized protein n=1 Tax=Caerostris darwini TaxID=1538125 RepID=A0AAV4RLR2_9ARAC|nr:uncharacterized protein CDAR_179771 [Caerostris darwini]
MEDFSFNFFQRSIRFLCSLFGWKEISFSVPGQGLAAINCSLRHVKSRWCMRLETISWWLNRKANHKRQNTMRYRKIISGNDYTRKWNAHSFDKTTLRRGRHFMSGTSFMFSDT